MPHTGLTTRAATPEEIARLEQLHDAGLAVGYATSRCVAVGDFALFAFGATLPWELKLQETTVSPGYAEDARATAIVVDATGAAPVRLFTAVLILRAH